MVLPSGYNRQTSQMRRSSALGSKTASGVNKTHYHIVTEALFSVDDDVSTSSLCQVERRKSKTLEYSNKVLQGPAAWGVVESAKAHTLAIPVEAIPSNYGPPQRLREARARYLCFPAVASK